MTIASEITNYANGLGDAYTAVNDMGGIIPVDKNMNNLDAAIRTIPQTPTPPPTPTPTPLNPDTVYNNTRPAEWLEMPADADMEAESMYFLLDVEAAKTTNFKCGFNITMGNSNMMSYSIEFGKVVGGSFVVDPTYSLLNNRTSSTVTMDVPISMFTTTSTGYSKQLIMRVTADDPAYYFWNFSGGSFEFIHGVVEFKVKSSRMQQLSPGSAFGNNYNYQKGPNIKYATLLFPNGIYSLADCFKSCTGLIAVRGTNPLKVTYSCYETFRDCYSLLAIPAFDFDNNTASMGYMFDGARSIQVIPDFLNSSHVSSLGTTFRYCYSLVTAPNIDTTNVTGMNNTFEGCRSLRSVPLYNTSNVTSMTYTFSGCTVLDELPLFDLSHVINMQQAFYNCSSLKTIPLWDLSSVTNMQQTFYNCRALEEIPAIDTGSVATFYQTFYGCSALKTIPLLDTSSATNFKSMFQECSNLTTVPNIDTSDGTAFDNMFAGCNSLRRAPAIDTSDGTTFSYMFQNCFTMEGLPDLDMSNATYCNYMYSNCTSLKKVDLSAIDFSGCTYSSSQAFLSNAMLPTGGNVYLPPANKAPSGGYWSNFFMAYAGAGTSSPAYSPINWIITDTNAMVPLAASAANVFGGDTTIGFKENRVYVPDSMYSTYTADSNWRTISARLKKLSELPS